MNATTNASAGAASSSAGVPTWRMRPSTITPTRSASAAASAKSWVTSSVGSASPPRTSAARRARAAACARRAPPAARRAAAPAGRAPARAPARRAGARRPRACPGRSSARWRDPQALEQLVASARAPPAERDVLRDRHVREQRVVLEDEADASAARAAGRRRAARVDPRATSPSAMRPLSGRRSPATAAQHRRLARARRPDERDRLGARRSARRRG